MEDLDVHPRISNALRKARLKNYGSILSLSGPDLERQTQLSANDVAILQEAVAKAVPRLPVITGLADNSCPEKLKVHRLTTGCKNIDAFLRGGVLNRGITEVAGESASGKTQLCMQLCITVQLPKEMHGLDSGALYICTEDVFPNKRLMQMVSNFSKKNANNPILRQLKFTDNIFIEHAGDLDDLSFCITKKSLILLAQGRIKLIIVDSIAALFRSEYALKDMVKRAKQLSSFAAHLQRLSREYGVPIVCVNQVSDVFDKTSTAKITPALGISWANQVTVRLMLRRTQEFMPSAIKELRGSPLRTMEVLFAPHLPNTLCHYIIDQDGVKGLT